MKIREQFKYWYRKYTPETLKKYFYKIGFFFRNIKNIKKILSFQFEMKSTNSLSDLSWMSSTTNEISREFLQTVINFIEKASKLEFLIDSNYKPTPFRQYEFEYSNSINLIGEHYKLLVSIINSLNLKNFTELGTGSGIACKHILNNTTANINTFDIFPWSGSNSHLTREEFENSRISYHVKDVGSAEVFSEFREIFKDSDLILLDASKDGDFENSFLSYLSKIEFENKQRYLLIDDIRYFSMFRIWNNIQSEKIDITSFGHWSGTGIVNISNGLKYKS